MTPFARRLWRTTALSWSAVLAAGVCAACIRLLPWLLSPDVPLVVAAEFARVLARAAGEAAYLVGLPVGGALAAALFLERGEARALFALGLSPFQILRGSVRTGLFLIAAFAAATWGAGAGAEPGGLANRMLEAGRARCAQAREPMSINVPLVELNWLCLPGEPPRLAGAVPGSRSQAWFTAESAAITSDLSQVLLGGAELAFRPARGLPAVRLRVAEARVTGLSLPQRGSKTGAGLHALSVLLSGCASAFFVTWLVLRFQIAERLFATALGVAGSVAALVTIHALAPAGSEVLALLLPPLLGILAPAAVVGIALGWGRFHPLLGPRARPQQ
ncbi:MAG TPA: hypothetical protein VK524_12690 [Polyangiaceae bacterium]|nr:hypothetical protein [Polyangiaceae bacterium]